MQIKRVQLKNFRNHASTVAELSPGINVIIGDNAQGKTNLLEAIYFTCVGRGFRSPRDREAIRFGQNFAKVSTTAEKSFGEISVEITLSTAPGRTGKQVMINQVPIAKMGELMGSVTCVFFNPDELRLVKESPADRRRFMDIDISQMNKVYFYNLLRYNKILKQRNALLKGMSPKPTADELSALDIWDEQLSAYADQIMKQRTAFCGDLQSLAPQIHAELAEGETLSVEYECSTWNILEKLKVAREKDLQLRTTTVGPHRDDILLKLDGKDVRLFASQGQQRSVALSLKIAELKIFERATGEKPILLLDDVLSELDAHRQARLFKLIDGWQCIITATAFDKSLAPTAKIFKIKDGKLFIS